MPQPVPDPEESFPAPIVVDLGKRSAKKIKLLKRGEGELMDEVLEAVARVRSELAEDTSGKAIVPIVLVYRRKARRARGALPFGL